MLTSPGGLLNVLKPPGMTSHDVVAVVRRLVEGKVGHTGTLDPLAAGVLVLTVGAATRLTDLLTEHDKSYRADFILGLETDTLDLEGAVTARRDAGHVTSEQVCRALEALTGDIEMTPPAYSAVRRDGRKMYDLARAGKQAEAPPRRVRVMRFELLQFTPGAEARCLCEIDCSKGTYVRSLAQMLGERLECGACLGFLLRTAQGHHSTSDALTLEELGERAEVGRLREALIPLARALPGLPAVQVGAAEAETLRHGQTVAVEAGAASEGLVMVLCEGEAVCLAEPVQERCAALLRPKRVFP